MNINNLIKNFKNDKLIAQFSNTTIGSFLQCNEVGISKLLAWLFDPNETHGLKNNFAKAFIKELNRKAKLGISVNALNDAVILTEVPIQHNNQNRRLDILITADELCIVIENKFGCKEHNNQLYSYEKYFEDQRKNKTIPAYFVYLDVNYQEYGEDNNINSDWVALNYDWIYVFLYENIRAIQKPVIKSILKEFQSIIGGYDIYDCIDELCLKHHELIEEIEKVSYEKITNFIFNKSTFDFELFNLYKKYQWIFDKLIVRNKLYNQIKLVDDIYNSVKSKNIIYNLKEKYIEFTDEKTDKFAEIQQNNWGAYIVVKQSDDVFSLKLRCNIGQFRDDDNFKKIENELNSRGVTIKSTDKRITVITYNDISRKKLPEKFDELYSVLKKLQRLYITN